jgi:hypothetical protein
MADRLFLHDTIQIERARETLNKLLEMFESGNMPAAIKRTLINAKPGFERPNDKWSLGDRLLVLLSGTEDARGFKQRQGANWHVRRGAKVIYILALSNKKVIEKANYFPNRRNMRRRIRRLGSCESFQCGVDQPQSAMIARLIVRGGSGNI